MNPEEREALVRTSTDAWNSNDFETLKAIWSPEGVIVSPEGWPEVGTFFAKMTYFLDEQAARAAAEEKR